MSRRLDRFHLFELQIIWKPAVIEFDARRHPEVQTTLVASSSKPHFSSCAMEKRSKLNPIECVSNHVGYENQREWMWM